MAAWYSRDPPGDAFLARFAAARQVGHRCGSLVRPLLAKNDCSPDEKTKDSPQSRQVNVRSSYTPRGPPSTDDMQAPVRRRRPARRRQEVGDRAGGLREPGTLVARRIRASSSGFTHVREPVGACARPLAHVEPLAARRRRPPRRRHRSPPAPRRSPAHRRPLAVHPASARGTPTPPPPIGHRPSDRCDRRRPALRRGGRVRPRRVPRGPRAVLHAVRRRDRRVRPERAAGRAGAGRHRPRLAAPHRQADRAAGPGPARVRARPTAASRSPAPTTRTRSSPTPRPRPSRSTPTAATRRSRSWRSGMDDQQPGPDTAIKTSLAQARRAAARLRSRRHARRATRTRRPPTARC